MSSSASGAEQHSNSNTSGRIGNIFDDPELVTSIMRMPSLPGHSVALLDALPGEQFVGQLQDAPARASGLQKPGSGDQSYMLEEESVGALRKRQALQEKSKKAQRRYRERKKAETEQLKRQIEELTGRMSELMAERDTLQNRNSLLEKVVQVRSASDRLVRPQMQGDGQSQSLAQSQPDYVTATATFLGLVYPGRGLEQTVRKEHMDNMTAADYMKVWKDYVSKLTHLLLALDSDDSIQAHQQIQEMVAAQRWAVQAFCRTEMSKLMSIARDLHRERQAHVPTPSPIEARCLLDRLKLSREQKHQIVAIRRRFLETMRNIMVQRRAATEVLQLPLPMRYEDSASLMCFADATIASEKSLLSLCRQQKDAYRLMQHGIREVLTPVQDARLLAEAYPSAPDPVQLSTLVAHELQDPSADFALPGLSSPDMGGLPPPGLSALSALPIAYMPAPHELPQLRKGRSADMLQDNTVTTGFL